jgi:Ca-activated chloride channel family protein
MLLEEQATTGLDVVVALDVSRSMLADDLPGTRLAVARTAVAGLLDQLDGDRFGLIAFAGSAFQVCPLTSDYAIARQVLAGLDTDTLPKGGSAIAPALAEARRAFRSTPPESRVLILVSDGEDHAGGIEAALEKLRSDGVAVFAAMAGTEAGGLLPLPEGRFVKDQEGLVVKSRASLSTLKRIDPAAVAIAADGSGLAELLQRARTTGLVSTRVEKRQRFAERYQVPLAAALLVWGAELLFLRRRPAP